MAVLNNRNINSHQQKLESMVTMKNRFVALLAVVAVITGLSSCLKNNVTPQQPSTVIALINGATPSYGMDLYFNTKKANSTTFNYAAYGVNQFDPAVYTIDFKKAGGDSLLSSVNANFDTLQYHTILIYGLAPVRTYNIREDFSDISRDKANVRFLNMTEGNDPVDFFINTTKLSPNNYFQDFLGNTDFQEIEAANVTITVKDAAGAELATLPNQSLQAFNAYSIAFIGTKGTTGDRKPSIVVLRH
jgi:hypothetical protein